MEVKQELSDEDFALSDDDELQGELDELDDQEISDWAMADAPTVISGSSEDDGDKPTPSEQEQGAAAAAEAAEEEQAAGSGGNDGADQHEGEDEAPMSPEHPNWGWSGGWGLKALGGVGSKLKEVAAGLQQALHEAVIDTGGPQRVAPPPLAAARGMVMACRA
jgi:hypothetical protein